MLGLETVMQSLLDFLAETLVIVVPVLISVFGTLALRLWANFQRGLPENYRSALYEAAELGADFAEVLDLQGRLGEYGHTKFHVAMDTAEAFLQAQGYRSVSLDLLEAAIESILFSNPETYHSSEREVG